MVLPNNTLLQGGKYKIVRHINGGGFSFTYEAEHVMLHKRVAIKEFFYKKETLRNADNSVSIPSQNMEQNLLLVKKKFIDEAIFLSQTNHSNIISVTDVFEENGTAYYVMDYIDGKSLNQILKENGVIPEVHAVDYICQVAEALKYVHGVNHLHLDIKPDNILVDSHSGKAILIDFGTCKHYDASSGEQTTGLLGMQTEGYAPIELANKTFSNFSPSTDIYELGATLYCLLSGSKPPIAASLSSGDEVIKPLPNHISDSTRHAVECSLRLRRKDRPQNVDEFLSILKGGHDNASKRTNIDDEATYFEEGTTPTHLLRLSTLLQGGKYKIVRHLSSGAFGNIYEALHTMRQARVAIKEFYVRDFNKRDGQTNNVILSSQNHREIVDRLRQMFKEEAKVGYQMKHEHIIPVIDLFEENNTIYYVMEYIDGRDLSDIVRTRGPLPESEVLCIINQVAGALRYIHSHKRLHLNVKPSKIIINNEGKAFLSVPGANEMYVEIHTAGYSPLEQIVQKYSSWSPATDIYALGATTYKLLTGITPPSAIDLASVEKSLQPLPASISTSTCQAVKKAMMLVRGHRPQSIDEFVSLFNNTNSNNIVSDEETKIDMRHVDENKEYPSGFFERYSEKLEWLAIQGDEHAQFSLGNCYYYGNGIDKDVNKAVEWYEKSAVQGYVKAQRSLGVCYHFGFGVAKDMSKAVVWYKKAAEQGDAYAQCNLGTCYYKGDGVGQDYRKAVEWLEKAAAQDHAYTNGYLTLGSCYFNGYGIEQDYTKAIKWYKKAAEQGHYGAQYMLGDCYYNGIGIPQDYIKAVEWYKKSAEQGYPDAQYMLGFCYYEGEGVAREHDKAFEWYKKAAEQGHSDAQCNLGACYFDGTGVTQDYCKAASWFQKAAEQGNSGAQFNLGVCIEFGLGIPKNKNTANMWYEKAAEQGHVQAQEKIKPKWKFW